MPLDMGAEDQLRVLHVAVDVSRAMHPLIYSPRTRQLASQLAFQPKFAYVSTANNPTIPSPGIRDSCFLILWNWGNRETRDINLEPIYSGFVGVLRYCLMRRKLSIKLCMDLLEL